MSQATLDDDELFDEAATEMRSDVEEALTATRTALPDSETIWSIDADNTLGVLNGLRAALDADEAKAALRDAKKWYTMGKRADAFEDGDDLAAQIDELEALLSELESARDQVSDLAGTLPELRSTLTNGDDGEETDS